MDGIQDHKKLTNILTQMTLDMKQFEKKFLCIGIIVRVCFRERLTGQTKEAFTMQLSSGHILLAKCRGRHICKVMNNGKSGEIKGYEHIEQVCCTGQITGESNQ